MRTRLFLFFFLGLCRPVFAQDTTHCAMPPCITLVARVPQSIDTTPPIDYHFDLNGQITPSLPASMLQSGFIFGTGTSHSTFRQIVFTSTYAHTVFMDTQAATNFPNASLWIVPSGETQPGDKIVLTWRPGALLLGQAASIGTANGYTTAEIQISPMNMTDPNLFYPSTFQVQVYTRPIYAYVTGLIQLPDCVHIGQEITFEFRPVTGTASFTRKTVLNGVSGSLDTGTFTFTDIPMQAYTVHIKGAKWLAADIALDTTSGSAVGVFASLHPGDASNDNRIDSADFGIVVNTYGLAYDSTNPNNGYDARADFTCDGRIDIGDFGAMVANYGIVGDP